MIHPSSTKKEIFTFREQEVLKLVAKGYSNSKIATELSICLSTVKAHIRKIMSKLKVNNRVEIVIKVYENNLI